MATFTQGLRFEYKRISGGLPASNTTVIQVPSSANYFVYLRFADQGSGGSLVGDIFKSNMTGFPGSIGYAIEATFSGGLDRNEFYLDDLATGLTQQERIISPNEYLQIRGNTSYNYVIEYVEVYFGGQANY